MIGSIRGTLLSKESGNLLIEVGGLGYEVQVPTKNSYNIHGYLGFLYLFL